MSAGDLIRELRIKNRLTQKELAGGSVTRNMISRIEHGAAVPSLRTLTYIAGRLGVSPGYLLADDAERRLLKKADILPLIKTARKEGGYSECRDICHDFTESVCAGESDPDIDEDLRLCDFEQAKDAFSEGSLRLASDLFGSVYTQRPDSREAAVSAAYSSCIADIVPSLDNAASNGGDTPAGLDDPFTLSYFFLRLTAEGKDPVPAGISSGYLNSGRPDAYRRHITARLMLRSGKRKEAAAILSELDAASDRLPAPMRYFLFHDLEALCRDGADYKGAYEYSARRRELFELFSGEYQENS